jgi:8-oxo-dGTP pyrophosphatase MutT (NUDIX family)
LSEAVRRLQALVLERTRTAPPSECVPLLLDGRACGSMAPPVAISLAGSVPGFVLQGGALLLRDENLDAQGRTRCLERAARRLVELGLAGAWRNEALDVCPGGEGPALASIDRCAVRALGITTRSVRLNGYTPERRVVVARRAAHKRVDPGMWDNLAGGIVTTGETLEAAMRREALEEAGLQDGALPLQAGGRICVSRKLSDGLLNEIVFVYDVDLPPGTMALNRDGEVDRFETWDVAALLEAIEAGRVTIEASLATLESLARRGMA